MPESTLSLPEPYLEGLCHVVQCLSPGLPFREALLRVLDSISRDMPFTRAHIMVQHPENGSLHLSMTEGKACVPHLTYAPGRCGGAAPALPLS